MEIRTFSKKTVFTYEWPAVCWASEQSGFETPAGHVLEVLRIHKCLQPCLQRTG